MALHRGVRTLTAAVSLQCNADVVCTLATQFWNAVAGICVSDTRLAMAPRSELRARLDAVLKYVPSRSELTPGRIWASLAVLLLLWVPLGLMGPTPATGAEPKNEEIQRVSKSGKNNNRELGIIMTTIKGSARIDRT